MRRILFFITLFFIGNYSMAQNMDYTSEWTKIDNLLNEERLPQSALKEIDKVYNYALSNKNYPEIVKAITYKLNAQSQTGDNSAQQNVEYLIAEASKLPQPARSVVYSFIGDFYKLYYQNNRWQIQRRTSTATQTGDDMATWDLSRLFGEALKYYQLSMQDENILQKTPIGDYKTILEQYNDSTNVQVLPTLYDFMVYRVIKSLSGELSVAFPQQTFVLNKPVYFSDAATFVKEQINSGDTLSSEYQTIKLYQKILQFRLNELKNNSSENNRFALVNMDIERLKYVLNKGVYNDNALYENALKTMMQKYNQQAEWGYPAYALAMLYIGQGAEWRTSKIANNRSKIKEAYNLCSQIIQKAPKSDIAKYAKKMQEEIASPYTEIRIEKQQYPETPILALARYKNTSKLYISIYRITDDYARTYNYGNAKLVDFVGKQPVSTQEITVPSQADYQLYSSEIKIDGLKQGNYALFVSEKPVTPEKEETGNQMKASTTFQVSSLNLAIRSGDNKLFGIADNSTEILQVYVTDSKTGEPAKKAKIDYSHVYIAGVRGYYDEKLIKSYYTDNQGIAYIQGDTRNMRKLVVTHNNNRLVQSDLYAGYWHRNNDSYNNVFFFTDRAIYRPGQTVYYKAIFLNVEKGVSKLSTKKDLTVEFKDVNYKTIDTRKQITNEYGTIEGSFTIPQGLLNGAMTLQTPYGSKRIQVEEYKRPTFEVKFDTLKKNYALNDDVVVTGFAKALAGYAVDNSKVQYHIVREVDYRVYRWWFPPILQPQREIASGEVTTDSNGLFKITFKAQADDVKNSDLVYTYHITADITDVNGETRSTALSVKLSQKPMLISSAIPNLIADRNNLNFKVFTTNLDGNPTPADVKVKITSLKAPGKILKERLWDEPDTFALSEKEFHRYFPLEPYMDENKTEKFAEGEQLSPYLSAESSFKNLEMAKAGWYRIDIKAKAADGLEVDDVKYVQLIGNPVINSAKKLETVPAPIMNMNEWFVVIKSSGEPGENAEFWVAGGEEKSYIRYDILLNDKLIEQKGIVTGTTPQKIIIPLKEKYRGGVKIQLVMVQNNRTYTQSYNIEVPYTNKQLDITFNTFRDKLLPGEKEKWSIQVRNKQGEKEMAEMVATLYDTSLDAFVNNQWVQFSNFYPQRYLSAMWRGQDYPIKTTYFDNYYAPVSQAYTPNFPKLNIGGFSYRSLSASFSGRLASRIATQTQTEAGDFYIRGISTPVQDQDESANDMPVNKEMESVSGYFDMREIADDTLPEIETRTNFNETAFFYPQLLTNENGEIIIEFTIPEALTRWKMMGFAHTKDLKIGSVTNELVTQKQVAISANAPRFFRENDVIEFTAKVNNITEDDLNGQAMLRLYDATNMQPVDAKIIKTQQIQSFSIKAGESAGVKWTLSIPEDIQAITYKVTAQAGTHTDGEEKIIPVLTNTILVTETMPFSVRAGQQKNFTFSHLKDNKSNTLRNHSLTLEFTSNPAWYAIQAMPYLMEYPYECSEQVFSRFYANSLSSAVANSSPRVKQIFDMWRNIPENKDALLSNLEKNQELKQVMLEETPWVMQAENETERKKRIGVLFDLNRMGAEQQRALDKLKQAQLSNGGFPWFSNLPADRFITQHIVAGMEHLKKLNALNNDYLNDINAIVDNGMAFIDNEFIKEYTTLIKNKNVDLSKQHISPVQVHYLYAVSFSQHKPNDKAAFDFYMKQAKEYWTKFNNYNQAMIALAMNRFGEKETANAIIKSLKERAQTSEEMGMYWKDNVAGYFWYQAPIETQAMLIEAFNEVANDKQSVEEMKIWLLRNKQTTNWKTTKATTEACYALLMTGNNLLNESKILEVKIGGKDLAQAAKESIRPEPGTGYVKTSWSGSDITANMADLSVTNPNSNGIAWGGVYWQYFEQLDKIKGAETNLKMNKQLFLKKITKSGAQLQPLTDGKTTLKVGDVVTVRMELSADRDFEYVHLKDMRAAGFEPVKTLSGYRYQDGLWYYESIKDASNNFFISYMRKGTYVFEYELRVTHAGEFSNGITTFQCMYAPEFSSHSEGIKVKITE